ncbi:MAG TPA: serine/threonine-protein kinase, partial [Kofleriaceae bacterium]|nr:serine/threonine-protein kinase [Kofleriaceae bacterium]
MSRIGDLPTEPAAARGTPAEPPALDRYVLLERLGEGGMGVVWAARDRVLDRRVALKVLHDAFLGEADQQRLAAEARAMARLSHPNVVAVYDVGERDGRMFMTMELVEGVPLTRWLETPRGWREVVAAFREAGAGLAAAHDAGIVHRDVKPSNILVGKDGRMRITDFGIACETPTGVPDAHGATTQTTALVGSPPYMAPERLSGVAADARGDQFAFCVALYEALHGRRPFAGDTVGALRTAMTAGPPPPIRKVPRWLHDVIVRGLAPDPDARFSSMRSLLERLRGPARRNRVVLATALAGAAALTAGGLLLGGDPGPSCEPARPYLAGVWDARVEQTLAQHFRASGLGFAAATWIETARILDGYADQWVAMQEASCRATRIDHSQSAEIAERRTLCLERRRAGLVQAVGVLGTLGKDALDKAPEVARGLAPIVDCADPAYLAGFAGNSDGDAAARGDLPAARTTLYSGQYREGLERIARVITAAHAAGDRALEAEALVVRGQLEGKLRDHAAAAETLAHAIELAGDARSARVRIEGWIYLGLELQALGRLPEAGPLLDQAEAALREYPDARQEGVEANVRGIWFARQSDYQHAAEQFQRATARMSAAYGPRSSALVATTKNLAQAERRLGRYDDAERHLRDALALAEQLGADHPDTLSVRRERAVLFDKLGRTEDAVAEFRVILAARRARFGDDNGDVATSHDDLAIALGKLGRHEEALAEHRAALAIRTRLQPGSRDVLDSTANVAEELLALGKHQEAEQAIREVVAGRERLLGPAH